MTTSIIRFLTIVLAALLTGTASGATPAVTISGPPAVIVSGPHANEEFCKTLVRQGEMGGQYMKLDPMGRDTTKRAKFFADSKALNATLVKTAPASLASDVARSIKNSDAGIDAHVANNSKDILASAATARSLEYLAVGKRMIDYCGVKM